MQQALRRAVCTAQSSQRALQEPGVWIWQTPCYLGFFQVARCRGLLGMLQEMEITRAIVGALWSYKKATFCSRSHREPECTVRSKSFWHPHDTRTLVIWSLPQAYLSLLWWVHYCDSATVYLHLFLFRSDSLFPTSGFLLPQSLFWDFESHPSGSLLFSPAHNLLFVSIQRLQERICLGPLVIV